MIRWFEENWGACIVVGVVILVAAFFILPPLWRHIHAS